MRTICATLAGASLLLHVTAASASPPGKVAILGPERSSIVPRLQRNFANDPANLASAVVSSCTRLTVAKYLYDLDAQTAICTDGDVVSVWKMESDYVELVDAVPITRGDDRSIELIAARVTIAARTGVTSNDSSSTMIVVGADGQSTMSGNHEPTAAPPPHEIVVDRPLPIAALSPERIAPKAIFYAGPTYLGSKAGGSFAINVGVEIGVSRVVTLNGWVSTIPIARDVGTANGTASYRPTIIGMGFGVPLLSWKNILVPRLGAGYALIWMHTWPGSATGGSSVIGESEDLWAPAMYGTAALSVRIRENLRLAAEGMFGTSTHKMIVRIASERTDSWGVPFASIGGRVEVVLP